MAQLLKDRFFTAEFVEQLARHITDSFPSFDAAIFMKSTQSKIWESLELKARMRFLSARLHDQLPPDFPEAISILEKIAPKFSGFDGMLFPDYVEVYGLDYPKRSRQSLELLTRYSSSEFAIRPFLLADLSGTMKYLTKLASNENYHVRRFASEGCRPRLPWAIAIPEFKKNPAPILPILEQLKADPEDYVRKSVANNLNDISKDHPDLILEISERWYGNHAHTDWIVKHACRGLLKAGNVRAMRIFGFADPAGIGIENLKINPARPSIGGKCTFDFDLNIKESVEKLRLEYKIDFVRKTGGTSSKVFQISESGYDKGGFSIKRKHSFMDLTTRKHYPGKHRLKITANGIEKASIEFELV